MDKTSMTRATGLALILLFSLPLSLQQSSHQMYGIAVENYALTCCGFASFSDVGDLLSCAQRCLVFHAQCKSFNFASTGPSQGRCELNSLGRNASEILQPSPGFVFVGVFSKNMERKWTTGWLSKCAHLPIEERNFSWILQLSCWCFSNQELNKVNEHAE